LTDDLYDIFGANGTRVRERIVALTSGLSEVYGAAGSHQVVAADLELGADAGTSDSGDTDFLAPIMGNLLGADLSKTHTYLAGLIGALSVTGTKASIMPVAALLGIVMDGVTDCDGVVVAMIDGSDPSAQTTVLAMFKARMVNNHASSGAQYGLDLQDSPPADVLTGSETTLAYSKAAIRLGDDVVIMQGAGAPVDGTTGDNFAGIGSKYIDRTNGNEYIQTAVITSPVWKLITRAA
jgi:hypothetical protein